MITALPTTLRQTRGIRPPTALLVVMALLAAILSVNAVGVNDAGAAAPTVLYRINVGGPLVAAADGSSPDWAVDNAGSPSAFRVGTGGGNIVSTSATIDLDALPLPNSAPEALFQTERWDPLALPEMTWAFPVTPGAEVELRLYFAETFTGITAAGQRVFDVTVDGTVPGAFDDIDPFATAGLYGAFARSVELTSDGVIDLEFIHGVENPALKGIEILDVTGVAQYAVAYDGNGSDGGAVPVDANSPYYDGTTVIVLDEGTMTRTGFDFAGWNTAADGTGTSYAAGDTFTIAADTTLYAQWVAANPPPIVDPIADQTVIETVAFSLDADASDTEPLSYALSGDVPAGMTINPTTGEIDWITGLADSGRYDLTVEVSDSATTVTEDFTLDVTQTNPVGDVLYRVNVDGPAIPAGGGFPAWSDDAAFYLGGGAGTFGPGLGVSDLTHPTVTDSAPAAVYEKERFGPSSYAFPVAAGTEVEVRLYLAEIFSGVTATGDRIFDVTVEGTTLSGIDPFAEVGPSAALVHDVIVTAGADGDIDIAFTNVVDNAAPKGIEILRTTLDQYTVTYDGNTNDGGTTPVDAASPYNSGDTVTVLGQGDLTKTGHTFTGWNTAPDGTGTSYAETDTFTIGADTTLYAQWVINTYTLTYDGNGNDGGTAPAAVTDDYNTVITIAGPGDLTLAGSTFTGWNTAADGTGTTYAEGDDYTLIADTTLYAQWALNPPPVVDPIGDQTVIETVVFTLDADASDTEPLAYALSGDVPTTMTINPTTGEIEWTPGLADSGRYDLTVEVSDGTTTVTEDFTLDVTQADPPGSALYRVDVGGPGAAAADSSYPDWSADTGATPSPYYTGGGAGFFGGGVSDFGHPTVTPTAPSAIYQTERYGPTTWSFPVDAGTEVEVRLHLAEIFAGITGPGQRVFDATVEGTTLGGIDPYAEAGPGAALVRDVIVVSDGAIDISLVNDVENAALKGIEILGVSGVPSIDLLTPTEGEIINGDEVTVSWELNGFLDPNDHVHVTLDSNPHTSVYRPDSSLLLTDVPPGPHTVTVAVANSAHVLYENPEASASVNFTTVEVFSVTYDGNGNDGGTAPVDASSPYVDGSLVTVLGQGDLTLTGFTFAGWNTASDGSGTAYAPGTSFAVGADTTLYAQWVVANPPPIVDPIADQVIAEGDAFTYDVIATDTEPLGYALSGDVPASMTIDPATGEIEWTSGLADSGRYDLTVEVTDGTNPAVTEDFTLDVTQTNPPGDVLYRVNVGGTQVVAADASSPDWSPDTGNFGDAGNSPYLAANSTGGSTYNGNAGSAHPGPIVMTDPSVPASAPSEVFNFERYDIATAPEMLWQFPVDPGTEVEVRLLFAELFSGIDAAGERVFDVAVEGTTLSGIDPFATNGPKGAFSHDAIVVSDGTIDIEFTHVIENPALKGIEILRTTVDQYTVTYDGNTNDGGTAPVDTASPYDSGDTVTVLGQGDLTKTEHTFAGWNTAADGTGTAYAETDTFTIGADTTLYAQWVINTYTLTFDGNGNDGGTAPAAVTDDVNTVITVDGPGDLSLTEQNFIGWNTAADGTGTSYAEGDPFALTADTTLYAQWELQPTVLPQSNAVTEGAAGTTTVLSLPVTLSAPSQTTVTVAWTTVDTLAQPEADVDYVAASGIVTFDPGETTATVEITVNGDDLDEVGLLFDAEWGFVVFSSPVNAKLAATPFGNVSFALIIDDDPTPTIDLGYGWVIEGSSGEQTVLSIPVTLSAPSGNTVTIDWTTVDTLAQPEAGIDYEAAAGTVTFAPGETNATVEVTVIGDDLDEPGLLFDAEWGAVLYSNPVNAVLDPAPYANISFALIVDDDPPV